MADGYPHFQQPTHFNLSQQQRALRRGTPPSTPSPSRSPAPQSPGNFFYGQGQGHSHTMMNPGNRAAFIPHQGMPKFYPVASQHGQQVDQSLAHVHNHTANNGVSGGHQHTFSGGVGTAPFPSPQHAASTPSGLPMSTHWQEQQNLYQASRASSEPHHHARQAAILNKNSHAAVTVSGGVNPNSYQSTDSQHRKDGPPAEVIERRNAEGEVERQDWKALDLGGQGLHALSSGLFNYTFLDKLYINHNKLSRLPGSIANLRLLTLLDASGNQLTELPPQLGMLTNLKTLLVFDNRLTSLPYELGSLYKLETFGIEGNRLPSEYMSLAMKDGTRALITTLRDAMPEIIEPAGRDWIVLDESANDNDDDKFQLVCYNILCEKYATQNLFGYVASWALEWNYRKNLIKQQLLAANADVICLQEVDMDNFNEYFMPELANEKYKGIYQAKTRARTMSESEKKGVDGCATFWNTEKFKLLDKQELEFNQLAIKREDFKKTADIFNRVMPKDNIAIIVFLENIKTGARLIVSNVHITWDPQFRDVKLIQVAIMLEHLGKCAERWKKHEKSDIDGAPTYNEATQIPMLICGDFNSIEDSGVYELLSRGNIGSDHDDLSGRVYGDMTRDGINHPFSLKSSYANIGELKFTNYTPGFTGAIDYIWYSSNALSVTALLGNVEEKYLETVAGFPNVHFPSDHIMLHSEFLFKQRRDQPKQPPPPPPDFGQSSTTPNR